MFTKTLSLLHTAIHTAEDHMSVVFRAADASTIRKEVVTAIFDAALPFLVKGEVVAAKALGDAVAGRLGTVAGGLVEQAVLAYAPVPVASEAPAAPEVVSVTGIVDGSPEGSAEGSQEGAEEGSQEGAGEGSEEPAAGEGKPAKKGASKK